MTLAETEQRGDGGRKDDCEKKNSEPCARWYGASKVLIERKRASEEISGGGEGQQQRDEKKNRDGEKRGIEEQTYGVV